MTSICDLHRSETGFRFVNGESVNPKFSFDANGLKRFRPPHRLGAREEPRPSGVEDRGRAGAGQVVMNRSSQSVTPRSFRSVLNELTDTAMTWLSGIDAIKKNRDGLRPQQRSPGSAAPPLVLTSSILTRNRPRRAAPLTSIAACFPLWSIQKGAFFTCDQTIGLPRSSSKRLVPRQSRSFALHTCRSASAPSNCNRKNSRPCLIERTV
jgi:hypothetical protein